MATLSAESGGVVLRSPAIEDTFYGCPHGGSCFAPLHTPCQGLIVVCVLVSDVCLNSQLDRCFIELPGRRRSADATGVFQARMFRDWGGGGR